MSMATTARASSMQSSTARPGGPPASFVSALEEFFSAVRRSRARAAREAGAGELTVSQYQLLAALAEGSERPVGELAEAAAVTTPTATRMLDGLERAGIAERRHSTSDRRVVTVRLTARGWRLMKRKEEVVDAKRRALFESLSPSERGQVERLLRRLAGVIEEL
jgi:MarR family transcriptional regulator, organic hydroperoxide resistance regulator